MSVHTVTSEDAHAAAYRDRDASADMVLADAANKAARLIGDGSTEAAKAVLHRAGASAERILGPKAQVTTGTVWSTRAGDFLHRCEAGCEPTATSCCWGGVRRPHTPNTDGVCQWCGWRP